MNKKGRTNKPPEQQPRIQKLRARPRTKKQAQAQHNKTKGQKTTTTLIQNKEQKLRTTSRTKNVLMHRGNHQGTKDNTMQRDPITNQGPNTSSRRKTMNEQKRRKNKTPTQ